MPAFRPPLSPSSPTPRWRAAPLLAALAAAVLAMAASSSRAALPAGAHGAGAARKHAALPAHAGYRVAHRPAWVVPVPLARPAPPGPDGVPGGARWWLVDGQWRLGARATEEYHRTVVEVMDDHGLDAAAGNDIEFDPTDERVTLHDVRVLRHGRWTSRLATARIQVLERETDLDSEIYDGRKTLSIALPDIRRGDVVDWSWTVTGRNPVFGHHRFGSDDMQWSSPVARLHRRLLSPADAPLHVAALGARVAEPVERVAGPWREITWDRRDVPALRQDEDAPPGAQRFGAIEWSDFSGWGDVVRWALPLYAVPHALGPALAAERHRIALADADPAARVMDVLRLVQRDVRYLGVEIGANSHAPRPPDEVYARRYGDCKEKALLMVTLLRSLGIDAVPALVDTRERGRVGEHLPSPWAFDHVITRVRVGGRTWWLDPTRSLQGGDLAHVYQPDYRLALPIAPGVTALQALPPASPASRRREVTAVLDASGGPGHPATLDVTTRYLGAAADDERDDLADDGRDELEHRYAEFYAKRYPGLRLAAPMRVESGDPATGELRIVERYRIDHFWRHGGHDDVGVTAGELDDLVQRPDHPVRSAPLAVGEPASMAVHLTVRLPRDWAGVGDDGDGEVDDPAFRLSRHVTTNGAELHLDYAYERAATEVPGDAAAAFDQHVADAQDLIDDDLRFPKPPAPPSMRVDALDVAAWGALLAALMGVGWHLRRRRGARTAGEARADDGATEDREAREDRGALGGRGLGAEG